MPTPDATQNRIAVPFTDLPDLLSEKVGGAALATNDDFFAQMGNLVKAAPAIFIPDKYTEFGKWMDGWESRRKRGATPDSHDWCVLRLGLPGVIRGFNVDTAFFVGNFPEYAAIDALELPPGAPAAAATRQDAQWKELVPRTRLQGGTQNLLPVSDPGRWTHLRLRIYPDGGVARLRVHGEARPDWAALRAGGLPIDLAALENGGTVVACNDSFFGPKDNLILPGRAPTMGDGWETRRRRGPGQDWIVVRLGTTSAVLSKIEVDTNHFKGNFPESCSIDGCSYPARDLRATDFRDRTDLEWKEILPRTRLQAHHRHFFEADLTAAAKSESFDYLRLVIYPDGGISRLRILGAPR